MRGALPVPTDGGAGGGPEVVDTGTEATEAGVDADAMVGESMVDAASTRWSGTEAKLKLEGSLSHARASDGALELFAI
jgi:hypothetical protein